jgi:outer membrane protein assembly factor BamE (lipoprotein component of BamABCDE complex)
MVDDLLNRYNLVGMSRAQIVDLLGSSNPKESKQSSSEYIYYLGRERGFISIDDEWLDIKFQGDLVVAATDRTD